MTTATLNAQFNAQQAKLKADPELILNDRIGRNLAEYMGGMWDESDPECQTVVADDEDVFAKVVRFEMRSYGIEEFVKLTARLVSYANGKATYTITRD